MCCSANEFCTKYEFCSEDNPGAPKFFKYLSCPNEAACEEKEIFAEYDSEVVRIVDKYTHSFVLNDVCSYIIYAPTEMQEKDQLKIQIVSVENADVYVSKGKFYRWLDHLDSIAYNGNTFDTAKNWQFYVVGVANSKFKGSYGFRVWVEKYQPETTQPDPTPDPSPDPDPDPIPETEPEPATNATDTNNSTETESTANQTS